MKLAYTAGPYRAQNPRGIVENIRKAEAVALELWRLGFAVVCPHKNTSLFDGAAPDEVWLRGDLVIVERCDLVVMIPGWEKSSGSRAERERALDLNIPVFCWPQDADALSAIAGKGSEAV